MAARDEILARIRTALADTRMAGYASAKPAPAGTRDDPASLSSDAIPRPQPELTVEGPEALVERFVDRLVDYKAAVTRCAEGDLPRAVAEALDGVENVVVPGDAPTDWLSQYTGNILRDNDPGTDLDVVGAVVTGCALGIAETGTIVLDAGTAQGRRALTLIPDHHVCVVRTDQVLADVGDAVARLTPTRPLTWISGPSATSDIELNRVEGVHGPRRLHVIVAATANVGSVILG